MTSEPADVTLEGVTVTYGDVVANDDVHLHCNGGELLTLLGPSGSGKTTALGVIAGFVEPDSGVVRIDGAVVDSPPHKRDIGVVFQNYALFPHMSALDNVAYPLRMRGQGKAERREAAAKALSQVQLSDRASARPSQLSGGQQQRVALARALVFEPRVVLMDEPLGALDKKLRESLQLEIRRIQQTLGITMIYVTHDQEEALVMSDRVAVFNRGRISQVGTGEDLYERPRSRFVAEFIGDSNIVDVVVDGEGGLASSEIGEIRLSDHDVAAGPASVLVRPERLELHPDGAELAEYNVWSAMVIEVTYLGNSRRYDLALPDGQIWTARHSNRSGDFRPEVGETVLAACLPRFTRVLAAE